MPRNPDAEKNNPCLHEQGLVHKCLNVNNYDKEKCELYFSNYKNCKDFWYKVSRDRRSRGIYPYLPDVEDRAKLKAEYMKSKPSNE
ncbi:coiled-coil-helix-coiled-coil-helix domain-containing protein 7 [Toxorhynchites rutilus septentrionalis]|uniref:coiled-coil-helix-coiled-coil-helix domain-containing protein 7 n=1 Tax=Toxorhynchites rutilus septentrionalis TaxID=329112 RepID=UPI002479406D|nr:coiled-coil-helix-coiled-coil-helix domain-containing protein 7 [Toxorhynchites rutilus septentrionalis]XP_055620970.1 coiled-coil-helix-coiled-coil-helix domain-containing protein 7 [Toxorhynchites rutilus septentrionalis]